MKNDSITSTLAKQSLILSSLFSVEARDEFVLEVDEGDFALFAAVKNGNEQLNLFDDIVRPASPLVNYYLLQIKDCQASGSLWVKRVENVFQRPLLGASGPRKSLPQILMRLLKVKVRSQQSFHDLLSLVAHARDTWRPTQE